MIATALTTTAIADTTVIEGFENSADPGNWQISAGTSSTSHTANATVTGPVPEFVTTHFTEGAQAGQFKATWSLPGAASPSNPYESGGPLTYWAARFNVNAPGSLNANAIPTADGILEADIYNASADPVQIALVVDSSASSQLERGPLVTVPPASSITYTWDFATVAPIGFDTGDGVFTGPTQRLKSLLVYRNTVPTSANLNLTVDNIRYTHFTDTTPPAVPQIKSVKQGPATGEILVEWTPSPDLDVASYQIYVSGDDQFNSPVVNRLEFPASPAHTTGAGASSAVISGLPTGENIYVALSASDNATAPNESALSQVFAANLNADGSPSRHRIVLDHDRYSPTAPEFVAEGYFHAVVYTAQALGSVGNSFDTVAASTIDSGENILIPQDKAITVWSALRDGENATGESLTDASLQKIADFINQDGNLILSGSAIAEDISGRAGSAPLQLSAVLRASHQQSNIGVSGITPVAPLDGATAFSTALNPTLNAVAYSTSANDGILPDNGSIALAEYNGIPLTGAAAGIGFQASLVYLGFAFETAGSAAGPTASANLRRQLMSEMVNYLIGHTAARDWQLFD